MRIDTGNGEITVRERAWPLAGLDVPRNWRNGSDLVKLANLPGGGVQASTYANLYRSNPWVYTSVQTLARGLSRLRIKTYQNDAEGNRQRIRSDVPGGKSSVGRKLDALMRMPEPNVGAQEWLRKLEVDNGVYGNALVVKDYDSNHSVPTALYHVPWSRVIVHEGEDVPVIGYEVTGRLGMGNTGSLSGNGSKNPIFAPAEVIHFGRGSDLDRPIGLSPMSSLKYTLALHDALWRHAVSYFQNAARPSGIVKLDKSATETTIRIVREQLERLYTAPESAGKILVTSGEWSSMSDPPDQSQIIELARLSREEISAAYGIPQPMMGILDRAILNNTKELRSYFTRDTLGPRASAYEDDFAAQLIYATPVWRGLFQEFDLAEMMRPDIELLADIAEKTRHVLTVNEQREKFFGMNPLDPEKIKGADTVWMPSGQIPLGSEDPVIPKTTPAIEEPQPTGPPAGDEGTDEEV